MRCTEHLFSASYEAIHRYDNAVVEHGKRGDSVVPCAVQPRDLAIVHAVWRYKFLTTSQVLELWWPDTAPWAGQRRLLKLFNAGYLDRFRPLARRGSYPWTYRIDREGLRLLQAAGVVGRREQYEHRAIYDYNYVLHDVQLNAWVIEWRRLLGERLIEWRGETGIEPPQALRVHRPLMLDGGWSAEALRDPRPRLLRPDAVVETVRKDGAGSRTFLVEFDRTGRVDKNLEKFRRYDAFLIWWWRHTEYGDMGEAPYVIFVCQTGDQRDRFLAAADHELTGHHWHPSRAPEEQIYVGRSRILFATEGEMHAGEVRAARVSGFPREKPSRESSSLSPRLVRLPGGTRAPAAEHAVTTPRS